MHIPPHAIGSAGGLPLQQLSGVVAVQTEEVCQLGGGVNFTLPDVLALAKHGGCNELISVLSRDQLGCLLEDGGLVDERCLFPILLRLERRLNGS